MEYKELAAMVTEEIDDCVYFSNPVTYELLYMNRACAQLVGTADWQGKRCHKVLQGLDEPCPFCNNRALTTEEFVQWEHYNASLGRFFSMRDKLIMWDGHPIRLEIAHDTTELVCTNRSLQRKLETEHTLMQCIQILSTGEDLATCVQQLLAAVTRYYKADRAYIFEINRKNKTFSNTYEWCTQGISPQIQELKMIPLSALDRWLNIFEKLGELFIPELDKLDKNSLEYQILEPQNIHSILAAPLLEHQQIQGFVGVDNPRENLEEKSLLRSLPLFIVEELKKRRLAEQLHCPSYTDGLTEVWNHRKYQEDLQTLDKHPPACLGIIYLDINNLKHINDSHGHAYGDKAIRYTASVLRELCPGDVYRVGGDEFTVLLPNISKAEFDQVVRSLHQRADRDPEFNPAIGSSWSEHAELSIQQQLVNSDQVMYANKQSYYSLHQDKDDCFRTQLGRSLLNELRQGGYQVYLQPQLYLDSGEIYGGEALIRRVDKDGSLILPSHFIPYFEMEGVIRHIDLFVLDTVCAMLRDWQNTYGRQLSISVNFSRVTMMEHDIANSLRAVCAKHGVSPSYIMIEVTESIGALDLDILKHLVRELKRSGFSLSLDDFGSQYSNLALLSEIPFDELKLDRSLVLGLDGKSSAQVVTAHALDMFRQLGGTNTVGEGIETAYQRDILRSMNCTIGQGFFFDRPMSIPDFTRKYLQPSAL